MYPAETADEPENVREVDAELQDRERSLALAEARFDSLSHACEG